MTLAPCLDCGEPSDRNRCPQHRPSDDKPSASARGYDYTWTQLSARARRLQPFCTDCHTTDDLTTDHSPEAWKRKAAGKTIRLRDVAVVCRSCNAKRGRARPTGGRPDDTPKGPEGKAEFGSLFGDSGLPNRDTANDDRSSGTEESDLVREPGPFFLQRGRLSESAEEQSDERDGSNDLCGHPRSLS